MEKNKFNQDERERMENNEERRSSFRSEETGDTPKKKRPRISKNPDKIYGANTGGETERYTRPSDDQPQQPDRYNGVWQPKEDRDYPRSQGNNRPYGNRDNQRPYGNRDNQRPYGNRDNNRPYGNRDNSSPRSDKPYGNRDNNRPYGNRDNQRPYGDRDNQRPYGNRDNQRPYGDRDNQRPYGERDNQRPYNYRENSPRPQGDRPYKSRQGGSDRPYDPNRSSDGNRSPQGNRPYGNRPYNREEKPYSKRPYDPNRQGQDGRPYRKPQGSRPGDPRRKPRQDSREPNKFAWFNERARMEYKSPYSKKKQLEYQLEQPPKDGMLRLNKFIANTGLCSRREADNYITAGQITVNEQVITELGHKINIKDEVKFNGKVLSSEKKVYLLLNKPKDYMTTTEDPHAKQTVLDLVEGACKERIYPVGRLDRMTTGVLLLTNDGDLTTKLIHPSTDMRKIYHVYVNKPITKAHLEELATGITLEDGPIQPDAISFVDETDRRQVGIEIHSGRNRIVRRIFEHLGYKVTRLDRVYFAGLTKKGLKRGEWRFLNDQEVSLLKMNALD